MKSNFEQIAQPGRASPLSVPPAGLDIAAPSLDMGLISNNSSQKVVRLKGAVLQLEVTRKTLRCRSSDYLQDTWVEGESLPPSVPNRRLLMGYILLRATVFSGRKPAGYLFVLSYSRLVDHHATFASASNWLWILRVLMYCNQFL
jgi:hypothetical protein